MNKFYVKDGRQLYGFNSIQEVILFLEKAVISKTGMNRKTWMENMADLGYGTDESTGKRFVDSLQERHFEIGVLRNNKPVRCNIFEALAFKKPEYGD